MLDSVEILTLAHTLFEQCNISRKTMRTSFFLLGFVDISTIVNNKRTIYFFIFRQPLISRNSWDWSFANSNVHFKIIKKIAFVDITTEKSGQFSTGSFFAEFAQAALFPLNFLPVSFEAWIRCQASLLKCCQVILGMISDFCLLLFT